MTRPRALVVAHSFPPIASVGTFRTLRVVRELAKRDWTVRVLTAGPGALSPGTPVDDVLLSQVPAECHVVRATALQPLNALIRLRNRMRRRTASSPGALAARMPPQVAQAAGSGRTNALRTFLDDLSGIPDQESGWLIPATLRGLVSGLTWRPDVVYSSAPPWTGHVVGSLIAGFLRRPLVADFRDPWARAPWRAARMSPRRARAAARLERRVVEQAAAALFTTRAARDEFAGHYGPALAGRFGVVPNGCDPSLFTSVKRRPADGLFVVLHAGSLYGGRHPRQVFDAIAEGIRTGSLRGDRFRLKLLGAVGPSVGDLAPMIKDMGLEGIVELAPRVDHRTALEEIASASALLLLQAGTTMSVPAKAYEYLASGRPLVAVTDEGETADLVRASGRGFVAHPDDVSGLRVALETVMGSDEGAWPVAPPELYDGLRRAAEIVAVLERVARPPVAATAEARPLAQADHDGTRRS